MFDYFRFFPSSVVSAITRVIKHVPTKQTSGVHYANLARLESKLSRFISEDRSIGGRRHGKKAVRVAAGIPVLADNRAAGVDSHCDREDSVKWCGAGHVQRDGR